ncbi:MAG: uncharacterized protein KVP18_000732 [Porospora cf. gigantea A]|uniref:uncharacterized protein n=1 Tax=Porospora cf. gigantea A TaxID=2853593 RepID=UPI00355A9334|nr:MAG: hypothetical protein KVP18_000732 [Porospora cf. gigantea A]
MLFSFVISRQHKLGEIRFHLKVGCLLLGLAGYAVLFRFHQPVTIEESNISGGPSIEFSYSPPSVAHIAPGINGIVGYYLEVLDSVTDTLSYDLSDVFTQDFATESGTATSVVINADADNVDGLLLVVPISGDVELDSNAHALTARLLNSPFLRLQSKVVTALVVPRGHAARGVEAFLEVFAQGHIRRSLLLRRHRLGKDNDSLLPHPVTYRSGLVVDMPCRRPDTVDVIAEGAGGRLVNQDLVNLWAQVSKLEHGQRYSWDMVQYLASEESALTPNSPLLDAAVPSFTLKFTCSTTRPPLDPRRIADTVGRYLRNVSTMHQYLHHSFNFYILTSRNHHVSSGLYLYPGVVMLLSVAAALLEADSGVAALPAALPLVGSLLAAWLPCLVATPSHAAAGSWVVVALCALGVRVGSRAAFRARVMDSIRLACLCVLLSLLLFHFSLGTYWILLLTPPLALLETGTLAWIANSGRCVGALAALALAVWAHSSLELPVDIRLKLAENFGFLSHVKTVVQRVVSQERAGLAHLTSVPTVVQWVLARCCCMFVLLAV